MITQEIEIPVPWGFLKGQIFGETQNRTPILCLHGYLDNSNSFKPLAPYLLENGKYYLIAIDGPGQGFSSKLNDPMLFNCKTFILAIRKAITHLNLKNFILLTHSFGCTLALMYLACFPEDVRSIVLLDFVFDLNQSNEELSSTLRESIDSIIKNESEKPTQAANSNNSKELTYEAALERLLKANRHVDEKAGKVLLDRSIISVNGKLEFSRDIGIPKFSPIRYHFSEFKTLRDSMVKYIKFPILHIYAFPYPYGEITFNYVNNLLNEIKASSNKTVEMVKFEGSHHFHMINPDKTSEIVLKFLESVDETCKSKSSASKL